MQKRNKEIIKPTNKKYYTPIQEEKGENIIKEETTENNIQIPKKVTRPFLKFKPWIGKEREIEELQEYVLFLMKNNGHTEIIENVPAGEFFIKTEKEEKSIMLMPSKLTTINYNKKFYKGWIAHEDSADPYPQDPIFLGVMLRQIVQKLALNYRDVNEANVMTAKMKMIIMWFVVGGIVLYILYTTGIFDGILGKKVIEETGQQIAQNISNTITNNTPTGVKII